MDTNDGTDATASGIELGSISHARRRSSAGAGAGASTHPFATAFALTPLEPADEETTAVSSAFAGTDTDDTATAGMTIAERRASRGSRSESFAFANRTIAIPQLTPPPDSPFEDDDERAELEAKLPAPSPVALPDSLGVATAPSIGASVPPTPAETPTPWRVSAELERGGYFASLQATEPGTESTEQLGAVVETEREIPGLPPIDGGRAALLFLAGACLTEGIVWGLPYSIGVLHEYWLSTMFKDGNAEGTLTMASTLPTAMLQFLGLPLGP